MNRTHLFCIALAPWLSLGGLHAQKAMSVNDLVSWKRITAQTISNDGQWAACVMAPWKGDAEVQLYSADGKPAGTFPTADKVDFSASSRFAVIRETPTLQEVESLKLKKTKKDKMPMNRLRICDLRQQTERSIDSLKSYRIAESADWIAYQSGRKDSVLHLIATDGSQDIALPNVSAYGFAPKGTVLYYVTRDTVNGTRPGLYRWTPNGGRPVLIKEGKGRFSQTTFSETGDRMAFLYTEADDQQAVGTTLWTAEQTQPAQLRASRQTDGMYRGWYVSPNGGLRFSKDGTRLFFGTAPEPLQKDSTVLAENRPDVQVWSGNEPVQYTVQHYNMKEELKRTYTALLHLGNGKLVQLADTLLPQLALTQNGAGDWAVAATSRPYSLSSMWEGRTRSDYYRVSLATGERSPLSQADYARYRLSPTGRYAYGYNETDSCWYSFELASGQRHRLSTPATFPAWDDENDVPDYPRSFGTAGWTEGDEQLVVYDRYDLWAFSPTGASAPARLTPDGREQRLRYRRIELDPEEEFIDLKQLQFLSAFNEADKSNTLWSARLGSGKTPVRLTNGSYLYGTPLKAKEADRVLFTRENFQTFPDLHCSDLSFRRSVQLTHGGRQQDDFIWGTAEPVAWTSFDGVPLEGVLYKPSNFDPQKKYPMIVNFYERNSETLNKYRMPEAHRSTIDYHYYLSNGYIIFNPDVRYSRDGFPGEDCYNCVMPGIAAVVAQGCVDPQRIGAQGHSWGGYQVAYLATRTNLFAAIESGAPVVNMFSAYGGIRWGSGLARSFQYEHTQSRIGGTPWDATTRYFENSPLFFMDKVHTPILIMHNDADGHVPWYQGIEYFVALKRLGRPVWMLNYPGEPHWPLKKANQADFQTRMAQFFGHYLKGEPAPKWMTEGVPAVKQPFELGY